MFIIVGEAQGPLAGYPALIVRWLRQQFIQEPSNCKVRCNTSVKVLAVLVNALPGMR